LTRPPPPRGGSWDPRSRLWVWRLRWRTIKNQQRPRLLTIRRFRTGSTGHVGNLALAWEIEIVYGPAENAFGGHVSVSQPSNTRTTLSGTTACCDTNIDLTIPDPWPSYRSHRNPCLYLSVGSLDDSNRRFLSPRPSLNVRIACAEDCSDEFIVSRIIFHGMHVRVISVFGLPKFSRNRIFFRQPGVSHNYWRVHSVGYQVLFPLAVIRHDLRLAELQRLPTERRTAYGPDGRCFPFAVSE